MTGQGLLRSALDFLLPPACAVCGAAGAPICPECLAALPWLSGPLCDRCGAPMGPEICAPGSPLERGVSRCPPCAGRRIAFRRARSALAYRGGAVDAVHALKYDGVRMLARQLASRAVEQWPGTFFTADAVTFVPLTRRREAERGYNQAEVLAGALGAELGVPVRPWLAQRRRTEDQIELDWSSRRANVSAAYELRAGLPAGGRRILLVDDVYTTGATVEVCARLLRRAGWERVHVWTLARVVRGG